MSSGAFAEVKRQAHEFLGDLRAFARGDYLRAEEKDTWDPFYDPAAIDELEGILLRLVSRAETAPAGELVAVLEDGRAELYDFNDRYAGAVLEPEELDELDALYRLMGEAVGLDPAEVPSFLDEDADHAGDGTEDGVA